MTTKTGNFWKKAAGCLLALTLMSACSSASAASSSSTITAETADISTKYAEVQSVNGSSVTVAYGTVQEKSADTQNGAAPSGAPDASAMPEGSAAPDMTSGATSASTDSTSGATAGQAPDGKGQQGQAPDGSAPQGGTPAEGAMPSMSAADLLGFTASGDTATITIDSDVTIIKNSQTVSVSDIAAGDILMITCTGDKVTAVEIMSAEMPQSGQPGAQESAAPTADATAGA
jgi:hypothetical protein